METESATCCCEMLRDFGWGVGHPCTENENLLWGRKAAPSHLCMAVSKEVEISLWMLSKIEVVVNLSRSSFLLILGDVSPGGSGTLR